MMQGYEGGSDMPEEGCGQFEVPLGNNSAKAIRALFLSDGCPALDAGSDSFYSETNSSLEAQTAVEVSVSGSGSRPINREDISWALINTGCYYNELSL